MALPLPHENTTALVTGSSSGIGAQIARELAKRGFGLTLVARREERLRTLAEQLGATYHVRTEVIAADLSDAGSRRTLPEQIDGRGLVVDILVNNAGFTTMGPAHKSDRDAQLGMVRTNVEAVVDLCTLFVPDMVRRRQGAILNTASTAAFQPLPGQAVYGASKAFVLSYGRALGSEVKAHGVTVTTLCPGPVATGFAEAAGMSDEEAGAALPKIMWIPAAQVAQAAVAGLAAGRAVVIPGAANRVGAAAGHLVPTSWILPILVKRHPALQDS
ncbi:MAG: SDR family NAD(P)-dependent oxidoreductase [Acidimicrobiales bacterium]